MSRSGPCPIFRASGKRYHRRRLLGAMHVLLPPPNQTQKPPPPGHLPADMRVSVAEFAERHASALWRVVLRILRDESETADVLREVFVHAWTQAGDRLAKESLSFRWMSEAATRIARERQRQQRACSRAMDSFEQECLRCGFHASANTRSILAGLIRNLPPPQRTATTLSLLRDLTHREIAACLGLSVTTVRARLELGLRSLTGGLSALRRAGI